MDKEKLKSLLVLPSVTVKQAMQKLEETAEKILFVVDESDRLLGTTTDGDIRRGLIRGLKFGDSVELIMHRHFNALSSRESKLQEKAKRMMAENKLEQIPILNDNGVIVDVILWTDMLRGDRRSGPKQLKSNAVVVMAGGEGTRLDPFTRVLPKPLIPIGNKPVMELIMLRFYEHGFHKFIYTLNYKKQYLKLFLKENEFPYEIGWVEEEKSLGTAGGLSLLRDKLKETFFVTNCDSLLDVDFGKVLSWHQEHKAAITIIGCHNEVKIPFGVLELSEGKLEKIHEKPTHDVIINTGVYVVEPIVLSYIPQRQKVDMNWVIDEVVRRHVVSVFPIHGGWFDLGQWGEYRKSIEALGIVDDL